jgi:hypothetical protein
MGAQMSFDAGDDVLIDGTDEQLWEYAYDFNRAIVVDHAAQEVEMLAAFEKMLPAGELSYACDYDAEIARLAFHGRRSDVKLTFSPKDRYLVIRGLNKLIAPEFEIRAFRATLQTDTHCFLVRPASWWQEMDQAFASRTRAVFASLDEGMDFA